MTDVRLAPLAILDLEEIGDYVGAESMPAAVRLIETLQKGAADLTNYPLRYPLVTGREADGIRMRPVGSYVVYYRLDDRDGVVVLRILHAARDRDPLLGG